MNFEQARFNMIEQQIRTWEVFDQAVLELLTRVPREDFVPVQYRQLAFTDMCLPLAQGEEMMPPRVEARILQALNIKASDTVLEIGTGSAYLTALLASLARHVYSVDIHSEFTESARSKLAEHNIHNVSLETADAAQGWPKQAPYDVIVITGSMPVFPEKLKQDLNIGGRLLVITGDSPAMEVNLITRVGNQDWTQEVLFETDIPPLKNAPEPERFKL